MTVSITEFLEARLAEDEAAANLMAKYYPTPWNVYDRGWMARVYGPEPFWEVTRLEIGPWAQQDEPILGEVIEHIALHDPARVLREVAAKRAIIKQYRAAVSANEIGTRPGRSHSFSSRIRAEDEAALDVLGRAVASLATAYSDHPDFNPEWSRS